VQSSKEIPVMLEGESANLSMRAEIEFVRSTLTVLVLAR
jgi:hypothetical protein